MAYRDVEARPLREEFRVERLLPRHDNAIHLASSPFAGLPAVLSIRVILTLYCLVQLAISIVRENDVRWLIFLTNWSFLLLCISLVSGLAVSFRELLLQHSSGESSSEESRKVWRWFHSVHLALYSTATCVAVVVTILYWALLGSDTGVVSISTHLINSVVVVVDLLLTNSPILLLNFWFSVVYAVIYVVFSVIYTVSGGTNPNSGNNYIYSVLDWNNNAGIALGYSLGSILVAAPILYGAVYAVFRFRVWVTGKLNARGDVSDEIPMQEMA